jgi:2-haloacid dehalogenase
MALDTDRVETVLVDSYGTLVDPHATVEALAEYVPDDRIDAIANQWRARSIMYTMVGNAIGFYQPFYEMNRDALTHATAANNADLTAEEVDDVLSIYHDLDVFADVRDGIERIRDGGYDIYVLSNGNPEMLESMVENAEIQDIITDTISADDIQRFKPDPTIYQHGAARTGTPINHLVHVAGPFFDVLGAMNAGMQAVWLNRTDAPWEDFAGHDPDLKAETFYEVADALGV